MDRKEVEGRVKKVVSEVLGVEEKEISSDSSFVGDLGAESVQSLELVAAFEEEFDIEMEEDAALKVQTIGKAVEFILKYLEEK